VLSGCAAFAACRPELHDKRDPLVKQAISERCGNLLNLQPSMHIKGSISRSRLWWRTRAKHLAQACLQLEGCEELNRVVARLLRGCS